MHFILLTMLLFKKLFWHKERAVCIQNIYCKYLKGDGLKGIQGDSKTGF